MSVIARTNPYSVPVAIGTPVYEFPFSTLGGDGIVIRQRYKQTKEDFAADMLAGRFNPGEQTFELLPQAKIAETSEPRETETGLYEFTRTWVVAPSRTVRDSASYAFAFPGFASTVSGNVGNVSAISFSTRTDGYKDLTFTSDVASVNIGDTVWLSIRYSYDTLFTTLGQGYYLVNDKSGSDYTIKGIFSTGSNVTLLSGSCYKGIPGRATPKTIVVPSVINHDFIETDNPQSIEIPQPFAPITNATSELATVLSANTTPTAVQYAAMLANNSALVVEASFSRWHGNIWQITTRTVPAR